MTNLYESIKSELNESAESTYTKVIQAIGDLIVEIGDEDKEQLSKYLIRVVNYCKDSAKDYDIILEFDDKSSDEEVIKELNDKLRNISTFNELEQLEKEMDSTGRGLTFRTRRAHWYAYSFTEVDNDKVHYLLGDGESVRVQRITDLWKYIEVANTAR